MTAAATTALTRGFGLGLSLIVAIGAQNAFVLRQGLLRRHVFAVALTCALCDAGLITLGVGGFGLLISRSPGLTKAAGWGEALFLLFYGARSFRAAFRPSALEAQDAQGVDTAPTLRATVVTAVGFSLLNPHALLDAVVLVGGLGAQYPWPVRGAFASGAMMASFVWFSSLAYGAGRLSPLFARPATWRVLDVATGIVMWTIALALLLPGIRSNTHS